MFAAFISFTNHMIAQAHTTTVHHWFILAMSHKPISAHARFDPDHQRPFLVSCTWMQTLGAAASASLLQLLYQNSLIYHVRATAPALEAVNTPGVSRQRVQALHGSLLLALLAACGLGHLAARHALALLPRQVHGVLL